MPLKRPAIIINPDKASNYPSSRGHSGGSAGSARIDNPDRKLGKPPIATRGEPSTSPDVNASLIMQNMIMNDDDKRWYLRLFKKQSKEFLRPRNTVKPGFDVGLNCGYEWNGEIMIECLGCVTGLCGKHLLPEGKKDLLTEPDDFDVKKKTQKKESNAVAAGNVRGPVSSEKEIRKLRKRTAKVCAKAFGGGQIIGEF